MSRYRSTENNRSTDSESRTTSTAPSAQEDFSAGGEREPGNTLRDNQGSGTIEDTNGTVTDTGTNNNIISTSGEITIYSPTKNSLVSSGVDVSGESSLDNVYYRLVDNISGVIATGRLKVVNGKFSGKLNVDTGATEGRIDFFGIKSDQTEFSNISIPIRF